MTFYIFSFLVFAFRVILSVLFTISLYNYEKQWFIDVSDEYRAVGLFCEIAATYAKISLGFFQVAAILVLNLQVR